MNPVAWVEIPTLDMKRAMNFYSKVFQWNLELNLDGPLQMSFFPYNPAAQGGSAALVRMRKFYKPARAAGALIYIAFDDILGAQERILKNGGEVLIEKKQISPDHGYMAVFVDSEGNRVGIHSQY